MKRVESIGVAWENRDSHHVLEVGSITLPRKRVSYLSKKLSVTLVEMLRAGAQH
jgi:hypothetical protein